MITDPSLVELAKKLDALAPADWDARLAIAEQMRPLLGDRYGEFDAGYATSGASAQKALIAMGVIPVRWYRTETGEWKYREPPEPESAKLVMPQCPQESRGVRASTVRAWLKTATEARDDGESTDWHSALYSLVGSMEAALAALETP